MNICDLCRFSASNHNARSCELVLQVLSKVSVGSRILDWKSHPTGLPDNILRAWSVSLQMIQQACLSTISQQLLQQLHSLELMMPPQWTKTLTCCQLNKA